MLQDLDRPIVEYEYQPWQRVVKFRVLSAGQFAQVMGAMTDANADDKAAQIATMSQICAMGIVDPQATADEWKEVTIETLMHLGNKVLAITTKEAAEEAKKN